MISLSCILCLIYILFPVCAINVSQIESFKQNFDNKSEKKIVTRSLSEYKYNHPPIQETQIPVVVVYEDEENVSKSRVIIENTNLEEMKIKEDLPTTITPTTDSTESQVSMTTTTIKNIVPLESTTKIKSRSRNLELPLIPVNVVYEKQNESIKTNEDVTKRRNIQRSRSKVGNEFINALTEKVL